MANLSNINDKFLVTTGGNVLIGQTSVVGSSIFQVTGTSTFTGELNVKNASTRFISLNYEDGINSIISHSGTSYGLENLNVRGDKIYFYTDFEAGVPKGDITLTLENSHNAKFEGNVGIGISAGANNLHIYKSNATALIQASNTSGIAQVQFFPRDASNVAHLQSIKGVDSSLTFLTGGNSGNSYVPTERMRITSGARINMDVMPTFASEGVIRIGRYDANTSRYNEIQNSVTSTGAASYMNLCVHSGTENVVTDVMTLLGSGNVGIGTTSPDAKLEVEGNVNSGLFSVFAKNPNAGSAAYVSKKWLNDDAGFGEIWRNSSTRTGGGQGASSFNMYNSADINFWSGATHTMALVGGNVGIGISTSLLAKLHLEGTGDMIRVVKNVNTTGPQMDLILNQTSPSNGDLAGLINFGAKDNSGNPKYWGSIRAVVDNIFTELGGFEFYTRAATDFAKRLKISAQGKVIVYQKDNVSGFYLDGANTRLYANGGGGTDFRGIECNSSGQWSWGETGSSNYFAKKIGIGATSVNEKLEVRGNIRIDSRSKLGNGEVDNITFTKNRPDAATGTYEMGAIRSFTTNGYSGGMTFYCGRHTGGGGYALISTMTIGHTSDIGVAHVGIGTTTPSAKLTIIAGGAQGLQLGPDTSSGGNSGRIFWTNSSGGWAMMALGQVLSVRSAATPGTTSGTSKVQLTNYSSTAWTASSDESLKENINSIGNVLDKINNYRCVEYNLIDDEDKNKKIGFIAQDWQKDFPQIVEEMEDEKIGMKYTETIPVLLKAIQELKAEIELLKNK